MEEEEDKDPDYKRVLLNLPQGATLEDMIVKAGEVGSVMDTAQVQAALIKETVTAVLQSQ